MKQLLKRKMVLMDGANNPIFDCSEKNTESFIRRILHSYKAGNLKTFSAFLYNTNSSPFILASCLKYYSQLVAAILVLQSGANVNPICQPFAIS